MKTNGNGRFHRKNIVWSREGEAQPVEGEGHTTDPGEAIPAEAGETENGPGDDRPYHAAENDDPFKRRIRIPGRGLRRLLRRFFHWLRESLKREEPTAEEVAAAAEAARLKQMHKVLEGESRDAAQIMSHALARQGLCYKRVSPEGEIRVKKYVTFDIVSMQEDSLWFHVDMRKLPYGVGKNDLIAQDVIDDLSCSIGRRVGVRHEAEPGVWYIIERASGRMGIPAHVMIAEMWERMPQTATSMTVPVGMTNNRKLVYDEVPDWPHAIVAGTTGGGKSNMVNTILCSLIRQNTKEKLQLVLVDLKEGMEFSFYEGLPHLYPLGEEMAPKGILYDREQVLPMLEVIIREGRRRMNVIREAGHKDVSKYNAYRKKNHMPRILVVVDEWADIRLSAKGKQTEEILMNAVQLLRAAGIHFIICTQVPSKEVLSMSIRTNLPAKFAFSCADMAGSLSILGNTEAFAIGITGRCVFRSRHQLTVQTPFISDEIVRETVRAAITGEHVDISSKHDVTLMQILEWGLRENAAGLDKREVYKHFKERGITMEEIQTLLRQAEGQDHLIGSAMYRVEPGRGSRPRRLVAQEKEQEEGTNES
jgi:hypothetical protein